MMENAVYSVISPEGCAAILWKDAAKADLAASAEFLREVHQPKSFAISLRLRHSKIPVPSLIRVAPFLLTDYEHLMVAKLCKARNEGRIIGVPPVPVKLDEIVKD